MGVAVADQIDKDADVPAMFETRRFIPVNQSDPNRIKFYANTKSKLISIPWKNSLLCGPCDTVRCTCRFCIGLGFDSSIIKQWKSANNEMSV
jgi:hypothetical protein